MAIRVEVLKELLEGYKKPEDLLGPDGLLPDVRKSHGPRRHIRKESALIVSSRSSRPLQKASPAQFDNTQTPPASSARPCLFLLRTRPSPASPSLSVSCLSKKAHPSQVQGSPSHAHDPSRRFNLHGGTTP